MKPVSPLPSLDRPALSQGSNPEGRIQRAWRLVRSSGWRGLQWTLRQRLGGGLDYAKWIELNDTLTATVREQMEQRIAAMSNPPLISVLMPTYNPNPAWLREAVESVRSQIYPHWELCIADDASTSVAVRDILKSYAETDARIKVVFRPENGHISASSNSALALASGPWLALMDHDDLLPAHALFCVADCIATHPDVRLIYSDEDKIDESGRRFDPYFKSDWNADLFRSQNMFSHLGVLATDLVREVGGFRIGLEGSQDWDLVLRCVERVEARQVRHVPRVLYHWRVHSESTAGSMDAKPYAAVAGERALNEHLARTGVRAAAEHIGFGYRIRYALPEALPLVSLIIPTRDAATAIRRCLDSILQKTAYPNYEIVVVDRGSTDSNALACLQSVAQASKVRIMRTEQSLDDAGACNEAVEFAGGSIVALLSDQLEIKAGDWLDEMVSLAVQPGVGAVGARLWYPAGALQHAGVILGARGVAGYSHRGMPPGRNGYYGRAALVQSLSAVSGACLLLRKSLYQRVGGLDSVHLKATFADVDLCLRLGEAGLRNVWTPYAELVHHGATWSPRTRHFRQDAAYMRQRWGNSLRGDPAYSPNLTLEFEDFSYAWPSRAAWYSESANH
ncbi:glycosyltransferase [Variovorax sp. J22R24]|uniref:glycosyltransferase family 2 protein n=1 Tax=Variovorax gracilis TaxID=3053502 RepID=UPI00257678B7|nr:glycosyltransferase [Variovorax sp. J22R24]MDM0108316.1 glycosyltransferase [Variovorax sp. J22R24]